MKLQSIDIKQKNIINQSGWNDSELERIPVPQKMKLQAASPDALVFNNLPKRTINGHIWQACTDFYDSKGGAPFKQIIIEKIGNKIKKTVYNAYLERVNPWDMIKNAAYKGVIAREPKKVFII